MKTILVVDDEFLIIDVIEFALVDAGYRVLRAAHGRKAMAVLAETRPDLIVTDYMMPLMNGVELAEAVKAEPATSDLPIVLLSGAQGYVARARPELFASVFDKPFDMDELVGRIGELLADG